MIPIMIGALGTISIVLVRGMENLEIRGRVESIQIKALLRPAIILRRVLETPVKEHQLVLLYKNSLTKSHMQKLQSVQENVTHKIPWNFKIKTYHLIPTRSPHTGLVD